MVPKRLAAKEDIKDGNDGNTNVTENGAKETGTQKDNKDGKTNVTETGAIETGTEKDNKDGNDGKSNVTETDGIEILTLRKASTMAILM